MKRIISILFIALSLIIANGDLEVHAQPTISNNGMFYQSFDQNGLLNGLISLWGFDETSGTTAFDSHGSNDGTNNGATINQTGKIEKAYDFDGISAYVDIGNPLDLQLQEASFSFWFYSRDNTRSIITEGESRGGTSERDLDFFGNGTDLRFQIFSTSSSVVTLASTYPSLNAWNHVIGMFDGSNIYLYINGVLVDSSTYSFTKRNTYSLFIGGDAVGSTWEFDGYIDQTAIWDRILTPTEISTLYKSGNGLAYIDFTTSLNKMYDNLIPLQFKPLDVEIPLRIAS